MSDVPLDPEPVLGWRAWRLERHRGQLRLASMTRPDEWPPMDAMEATCGRGSHADTPGAGCSCGIYATREPEDLPAAGIAGYGVSVVGAIAMWGRVVEHAAGARAQKAYPVRLRLICGDCLATGRGAVDPLRVVEQGSTLTAVCAAHVGDTKRGVDARAVQWELLSTYAVDLLPHERVADALKLPRGAVPNPARVVGRAVFTGILMVLRVVINIVMAVWVFSWVIGIGLFAWGIVGSILGFDQPVAAESTAPPDAEDLPYVLADFPRDDPPTRIVCGTGRGDRIEFATCASGGDDVFGIAMQEPGSGPFIDCREDWVAYSSDDDHWVCWHPVKGEDPDVAPLVTAPDPFATP